MSQMRAPKTAMPASPVVNWVTSLKTACNVREKKEEEPKLTLLTLTQRKTHFMKKAKPKEAGWH
jgi:hypothetical protein